MLFTHIYIYRYSLVPEIDLFCFVFTYSSDAFVDKKGDKSSH